MYTEIRLIREDGDDSRTLGELLKDKAEEGCAVYIMVC